MKLPLFLNSLKRNCSLGFLEDKNSKQDKKDAILKGAGCF